MVVIFKKEHEEVSHHPVLLYIWYFLKIFWQDRGLGYSIYAVCLCQLHSLS